MPVVAASGEVTILRSRAFRSVALETDGAGRAVVAKRFHHPHPLLARFDRRRAEAEYGSLLVLRAAGLPVPMPLELRACPGGWEVRLEPIAGARGLEQLLLERTPPPGGWRELCARLGALLAAYQSTEIEHRDLHPGNVLVDQAGQPWLIDFHRSRRRARTSAARERELLAAVAASREALPPRTRARFLLAWLAAGREHCSGPARAQLARRLEHEGRRLRRALVLQGLGRWLRESSRVRMIRTGGRKGCLRRELPLAALAEIERGRPGLLVLEGRPRELRARWLVAARLLEHGVRASVPALYLPGRGRSARAIFEQPRDACPALLPTGDARLAQALGAWFGRLHERGLDLCTGELAVSGGELLLCVPAELVELEGLVPPAHRLRQIVELALEREARDALRRAYLSAFSCPFERTAAEAALEAQGW